jgi:fatty-acyl-CoA synthase
VNISGRIKDMIIRGGENCRGQIASYKIPRYIRFTAEFPTTVTGKVQKFRMREISVEELGLSRADAVRTA